MWEVVENELRRVYWKEKKRKKVAISFKKKQWRESYKYETKHHTETPLTKVESTFMMSTQNSHYSFHYEAALVERYLGKGELWSQARAKKALQETSTRNLSLHQEKTQIG